MWVRDRTPRPSQNCERSNSPSACCRWRLRNSRAGRPRFEKQEAAGWGNYSSFFARSGHGVGCDSLTRALPRMSRHARKRPERRLYSLKLAKTWSARSSRIGSSFALLASRRSGRSDQVHVIWRGSSHPCARRVWRGSLTALPPNRRRCTTWKRRLRVWGPFASALPNFLTSHNTSITCLSAINLAPFIMRF